MRQIKPITIIFETGQPGEPMDAQLAAAESLNMRSSLTVGQGSWLGERNLSFALTGHNRWDYSQALAYARALSVKFDQQAVAVLNDGQTRMALVTPETETLDFSLSWREVSEAEAHKAEGWSKFGNRYYVAS